MSELVEIVWRDLGLMFLSGFDFKRLAAEEKLKYFRSRLVNLASVLLKGVRLDAYKRMDLRVTFRQMRFRPLGRAAELAPRGTSFHAG